MLIWAAVMWVAIALLAPETFREFFLGNGIAYVCAL